MRYNISNVGGRTTQILENLDFGLDGLVKVGRENTGDSFDCFLEMGLGKAAFLEEC